MQLQKLNVMIVLNLLVFYNSFTASAQCPALIWADEFTGTSLDLAKWSYQIGDGCSEGICGWGNNELQYYQSSNVTVSNGQLHITAKKERVQSKQYTSGRIRTINKGDWTYGRFEARIKLPYGQGLWPAFWMLPTDQVYGGWPQSGEIDIMEFVAATPDHVLGTIHYGDPYPNNKNQGANFYLNSGNFPDAFHDFAIEWEAGIIRWFVDDILFLTKTSQDLAPYNWPFDQRFHFLINMAVGGNLGGPVDNSIFPKTLDVEYVRVYNGFKPYINGKRVVMNQETGVVYNIGNLPNGTNVSWTVPAGATITAGQGTNQITVNFGTNSGNVVASFSTACGTQQLTIPVLVEPPYSKEFSFENFDEPATATLGTYTGSLTEVANPSPSGVNTSALVGRYVRNSTQQYDVLTYNVTNITDATQYSNKTKKFYIDIYTSAPIGTEILLQLETANATSSNYPTGRHSRYLVKTSKQNQWERLPFALLDKPDAGASATGIVRLILLFASNTFTGDTYFYDNLDSYTSAPTGPATTMSVASITTGTVAAGGGSKFGLATVTVKDNQGNPVPNATVTGTFSGSFNETKSGVTNSSGVASIQTTAKLKGTLTVNFCVNNITHNSLTYNAAGNTITCTGGSSRVASDVTYLAEVPIEPNVAVYPNPFEERFDIRVELPVESPVSFTVYDLLGRKIEHMPITLLPAGAHTLKLNQTFTDNLYVIRVQIGHNEFRLRQMKKR
jgi:beta-glucanase (GH16 family)